MLLRLMCFFALAGIAILFDLYFENHPEALGELQTQSENTACDHGTIYLFSQSGGFNAKSHLQKSPAKKLLQQTHNKLLQKCHQLRNHQALKAESRIPPKPLFLLTHLSIFRHYYFIFPDDDLPVS